MYRILGERHQFFFVSLLQYFSGTAVDTYKARRPNQLFSEGLERWALPSARKSQPRLLLYRDVDPYRLVPHAITDSLLNRNALMLIRRVIN